MSYCLGPIGQATLVYDDQFNMNTAQDINIWGLSLILTIKCF